jgi:hypothetical protein
VIHSPNINLVGGNMLLLNKHSFTPAKILPKTAERYTCSALCITPEYTEATDGHRLIRVTNPTMKATNFPVIDGFSPNGDPKRFLLPTKTALAIQKAIPSGESIPILNYAAVTTEHGANGESLAVAVTDLAAPQVFRSRPETTKYPESADKVINPDTPPTFQVTVNAAYLAELATIAKGFSSGSAPNVTLTFFGTDKVIRMDSKGVDQHLTMVLMPMRHETRNDAPTVPTARRSTDKANAEPAGGK